MQNNNQSLESYLSEKGIHIIHNGRFYFSADEGGRKPSWCHLKILQGKHKTLVILSQPKKILATRIFDGVATIATQITNLFGLDPALTIYLEFVPPEVPTLPEELKDDPMMVEHFFHFNGPGDEKFDRITFQWSETDAKEPLLERYSIHHPYWTIISPGEAAKLRMEVEKQ